MQAPKASTATATILTHELRLVEMSKFGMSSPRTFSNPRSQPDELFLFPIPVVHFLVNCGQSNRSPLACQPVFGLFFELFLATEFTLLTTRNHTTNLGIVTQNRTFLTPWKWADINGAHYRKSVSGALALQLPEPFIGERGARPTILKEDFEDNVCSQ